MTKPAQKLAPIRHPQKELFICDVSDAILKDITPHMEHPFYSLSKKPDLSIRVYEHNGNSIEIIPSVKGIATIYDKDILIYCISQIIDKLKRGEEVSKRVQINSRDALIFTNRGTGGKDYVALSESLDRLAGTRIKTSIRTGEWVQEDFFGLIESATIKRKYGLDGRLLWCRVTLSDWLFNAIKAHEVLTLHPDYFRLRRPLEKRIYEISRKHCGQQKEWSISLELLYKKSGSKAKLKEFKRTIKELVLSNHLPDYAIFFDTTKEVVKFSNRNKMPQKPKLKTGDFPYISLDTIEKAKKAAPRYDVYYLLREWQIFWSTSGKPVLKNPEGAFIAFCKKRYEDNPNP